MSLCEYLPRLETISVKIVLGKDDTEPTISGVAFSKRVFTVVTRGAKYSVVLPVENAEKLQNAKITQISANGNILSIRISLNSAEKTAASFTSLSQSKTQKWSVSDLVKTPKDQNNINTFQFLCTYCDTTVVDSKETKYADMPSEYWHELMDFWHCHKPHQSHHDNHQKSYGAIVPKPGHVYIGASYLFLLRGSSKCYGCKRQLGEITNDSAKLYKWNLKLKYGDTIESYPPYAFAYYAILDRINSGALRKLQVKSTNGSIRLWILSVGLSISYDDYVLSKALKILYTDDEDPDLEVLDVPAEVFDSLTYVLKE
ncbi:hypothetical protein CXQ85_002867 [Candidozyma haemuli]|uniref:Ubiquitin-conjugating enzyme E2-binding protein n=1 Tax=Candidozyma haemuli TaxID=45357 RepID=A0A2V1AZP5_9ASCO|nr:hypothetical protein CXQ85_002867 [[Candida] haemuloni]PVH23139.1 hypothetical protein CXQ85_002867 [[Candida] haemuloni]